MPAERPRGLYPCDLIGLAELAALLRCRESAAKAWAERRGLVLHGPGKGALFVVHEVLDALRDVDTPSAPPPAHSRSRGSLLPRVRL